jgi:hypothetical protein
MLYLPPGIGEAAASAGLIQDSLSPNPISALTPNRVLSELIGRYPLQSNFPDLPTILSNSIKPRCGVDDRDVLLDTKRLPLPSATSPRISRAFRDADGLHPDRKPGNRTTGLIHEEELHAVAHPISRSRRTGGA